MLFIRAPDLKKVKLDLKMYHSSRCPEGIQRLLDMAICYPRAAGRKIERASASAIQWALKMEGLGAGGWVGLVLAEVPEGTKHCVGPWLCPGSALKSAW